MQNGANIYHVSKLLGHSSVDVTEIYTHEAPSQLQSTVDLIPTKQPQLSLVNVI